LSNIDDLSSLVGQYSEYWRTHQLELYDPYEFQKNFHHAKGLGKFVPVPSDKEKKHLGIQRALMCANQIGKSFCGGRETAFHLTGLYPDWWEGHRFNHPVEFIASSTTNETTRDRCQRELFGEPSDEEQIGTGAIPKECVGKSERKPGVTGNAKETVLVKHFTDGKFDGWSKVYFKPYEQGQKKFMGYRIHGAWCDEEPPSEVWSQILRATLATNGMAYITFTPEEGVTEVVHGFMNNPAPGQVMIRASWDDAPHMTPEMREQKLAAFKPHERKMRSSGEPLMGTGMIFPVDDDQIRIDPIELPRHWPRICGVDFGYDHPFAAFWWAWDRDTDTIYGYDEYREERALMAIHAEAVNRRGSWIPVVWPHDGMIKDKSSGKPLADKYRDDHHMNMWRDCFSNPPQPGKPEGTGGQGREVGLLDMLERMETGRLKVFSTCRYFFEEKGMYHRKNGEVVALKDDIMSASRLGAQSLRFASIQQIRKVHKHHATGLRNW